MLGVLLRVSSAYCEECRVRVFSFGREGGIVLLTELLLSSQMEMDGMIVFVCWEIVTYLRGVSGGGILMCFSWCVGGFYSWCAALSLNLSVAADCHYAGM